MNWYLQNGNESDVVISSRIKFARNIKGLKFKLENIEEINELENKIKDNLFNIGFGLKFFKLSDMDEITKMSLVEKHLISMEFVLKYNEHGSILINDEENICIMVGGDDHLQIQVFREGFDLDNTLNLAIEIDERLEELLGYSVSKKYGYLTAYPNNVGTALKASCMVHLPALENTMNMRKILEAISQFGIKIKGVYDENNENYGSIYQITNKQTLGITEKEICENVKVIVEKIIKQEREARKILAKNEIDLEDFVYRSFGILQNCRKLSSKELPKLLSNIKLGTDLGIIKEIDDLKVKKLYLYTKPANLQKYYSNHYEKMEREIKRAEIVKSIMKG